VQNRLALICLWTGLVGVAFVLASPVLLSALVLVVRGELHFDYLLSAELGAVALFSSALLLLGTILKRSPYLLLGIGLLCEIGGLTLLILNPSIMLAYVALVLYNLGLAALVLHTLRVLP